MVSDDRVGPNFNRAAAAENGTLVLGYYDENASRDRFVVAYVGENGIEPGVYYYADENGRIRRAAQPSRVRAEGAPLIPLSLAFQASYIVTGGTKRDQSTRSSLLEVKAETSIVFDGVEIFILRYTSPEFETLQFAANIDTGYADANYCYTGLSLHNKYPVAAGEAWEYIGGDGADPEAYQMTAVSINESIEADGVAYNGCIKYQQTGIGSVVVTDIVLPGVGLIDHLVESEGTTLTHWVRKH